DNLGNVRPATFREDEGVDVIVDDNGSKRVGFIDDGEWLRYTVDVPNKVSGQFSFDVSARLATDGSIRVVAGPDDQAEPCKADSYTDLTGEVEFTVQT
ncbi:unnamed protein product, partial [Scytosiphon promiscuus]